MPHAYLSGDCLECMAKAVQLEAQTEKLGIFVLIRYVAVLTEFDVHALINYVLDYAVLDEKQKDGILVLCETESASRSADISTAWWWGLIQQGTFVVFAKSKSIVIYASPPIYDLHDIRKICTWYTL